MTELYEVDFNLFRPGTVVWIEDELYVIVQSEVEERAETLHTLQGHCSTYRIRTEVSLTMFTTVDEEPRYSIPLTSTDPFELNEHMYGLNMYKKGNVTLSVRIVRLPWKDRDAPE